jgi:hypothetical protein
MDTETPATYAVQTLPIRDEGANNEIAVVTENDWFSEPLSVTGILNRSFDICRAHFWNLTATSAVFFLMVDTIFIGADIVGHGHNIASILFILGLPIYQGAIVYAVSSIFLGREAPIQESYKIARRKAKGLLLTWFVVFLIFIGLSIPCAVLGIACYNIASSNSKTFIIITMIPLGLALLSIPLRVIANFGLIWEVVMIEDVAYSGARRRSRQLLSGAASAGWPKSHFIRYALVSAIALAVYFSIEIVFFAPWAAMSSADLKTTPIVVLEFFQIIAHIVGGTFLSVTGVVFYFDIRNRKEGFDLQQLASQVSR